MPIPGLGLRPGVGPSPSAPPFDFSPRPLSKTTRQVIPQSRFTVGDRIKDTAALVTASLVTLMKANPTGFCNFQDGVGDGNYTFYVLVDANGNWEAQYGLYADVAGTLTRAALPLASSTTPGLQVNFIGAVAVFGNWPAGAEMATAYGVQSGYFIGPFNRTQTNNTLRSNYVFYAPIFIPMPFSSFQVLFSGGAAPNSVDVGLYSNWRGAPYQLMAQQSGMALAGGGQQLSSVISCQPSPSGMYWAAMCVRNNGAGEGTQTFFVVNNVASQGDVMGTTATNIAFVGYYEQGVTLPGIAAQDAGRAIFGNFPFIPALWVRPIS